MTDMPRLPHHKLIAFGVAKDLLIAVRAGRVSLADKARAFTIARGEACEAAAALEVAALSGDARPEDARRVAELAGELIAILTALIRRAWSRASD